MFLESFVNIGHKGIVYVTLRVLYESERLCSRMCERKNTTKLRVDLRLCFIQINNNLF